MENATVRMVSGLGNPGAEHRGTRHNAGWEWIDALCAKLALQLDSRSKFQSEVGRAPGGIIVQRTLTYMNDSGIAVATLARYHRLTPEEVLVVHDEIDLPPGVARLKCGGGDAGHNGLRSVSAHLGERGYWRLRLGVGRPPPGREGADHVLGKAPPKERELTDHAIERSIGLWDVIASGDMGRAMRELRGGEHDGEEER